jgi:hypothetical protein
MSLELNIDNNGIIVNEISTSTNNKKIKLYNTLDSLDEFLENEKNNNSCEPWCKLDKTTKIKKLLVYAENYKNENNLSIEEYKKLILFFRDCLDKKKMQRVKDVDYDKNTGIIKNIPALIFNKTKNNFTLKNVDKKVSTIKSLAPKKSQTQKTIKNKLSSNSDSENDE